MNLTLMPLHSVGPGDHLPAKLADLPLLWPAMGSLHVARHVTLLCLSYRTIDSWVREFGATYGLDMRAHVLLQVRRLVEPGVIAWFETVQKHFEASLSTGSSIPIDPPHTVIFPVVPLHLVAVGWRKIVFRKADSMSIMPS